MKDFNFLVWGANIGQKKFIEWGGNGYNYFMTSYDKTKMGTDVGEHIDFKWTKQESPVAQVLKLCTFSSKSDQLGFSCSIRSDVIIKRNELDMCKSHVTNSQQWQAVLKYTQLLKEWS